MFKFSIKNYYLFLLIAVFFSALGTERIHAAGVNINANTAIDVNTGTLNINVNDAGNLNIFGTLTASGSGTPAIGLTGTWTVTGSFVSGSSTVNLTGSNQFLTGTNTFYKLAKTSGSTLTFGSSTTQTIQNDLNLSGISLMSSSSPVQFFLNVDGSATTTLSSLNIKDSNVLGGATLTASSSVDSGNNNGWVINAPVSSGGGSSDDDVPAGGGGGAVPTPTPVPVTDFVAQPTSGTVPLTVSFTDASTGSISNRLWEFGDGQSISTSSGINVSHLYNSTGTFTVSLEVTRSGAKKKVTKSNFISVLAVVVPTPTPIFTPIATPTPVQNTSSITGNVAEADGNSVNGIKVDAFEFETGLFTNSGRTDESGNYSITNLLPGDYAVGIDITEESFRIFKPQFFDNVSIIEAATLVKVNAGSGTASINFVLTKTSFISGKITDKSGAPLKGIIVEILDATTENMINNGFSDENGNYTVQVEPGSYKVAVNTVGTDFWSRFFDDTKISAEAVVINITQGSNVTDINFVLTEGLFISGNVSDNSNNPIPGIFVNVFDLDIDEFIGSIETDTQGNYAVRVPPGKYELFVDVAGRVFSVPEPQAVTVGESNDVSGIDFVLISTSIRGTVSDTAGNPLSDLFVEVVKADTVISVNFSITDGNGNYSIPVPAGSYTVNINVAGTNFKPVTKDVTVIDSDVVLDFVLEQEQTIRGNVTNSVGIGLEGMIVNAFDFNTGFWAGLGITDTDGNYSIPIQPGGYKVEVDTFGTEFKQIFFDNKDWDSANEVLVSKGEDTLSIDFVLSQASFITGIVTDGTNPLSGIFLDVFNFDTGTWVNFTETGDGGTYTVSVREGNYKIEAIGVEQGFSNEFFDDKAIDTADSIVVLEGETKSGVDFVLSSGGSISGVVSFGDQLLDGIEVNAFEFGSDILINGTVTVNGAYMIDGLPEGNYRLWAFDAESNFQSQFYDGVSKKNLAISVTTINGANTPDVNFDLKQGGFVNGKVTDTNDVGQNSITVEAYEAGTGQWINSSDSNVDGNYSIILPSGIYNLRAVDVGGTFTASYFDNATSVIDAEPVTVVDAESTNDINFSLTTGSFIAGEVKDDKNKLLKGIKIDVFDFNTEEWITSTVTRKDGKYRVSVSTGSYLVSVIPDNPRFVSAFYNNVSTWNSASPISVTEVKNAENINFRLLTNGGIITGIVRDDTGTVLSNIIVQTFGFETELWANEDVTNSNGVFSLTVQPGRYRIRALPLDSSSNISSEFFNNKEDLNLADAVTVTAGETLALDDIELSTGNAVSGTVLNSESLPVSGAKVDVFIFDTGSWVISSITDKQGKYTINGLFTGDYKIKVSSPPDINLAGEFFDDSSNWDGAKRVTIDSVDIDGINFTLSPSSLIAGKVVEDETGNPISGIQVDVFEFDTGAWVNNDVTDGFGNYTIHLKPGVYIVRSAASGVNFVDEFFNGVLSLNKAKAVVVSADINAITDFRLSKGATLNGKIVDNNNAGIAGSNVDAFNFDDDSWVNNDLTDSDGAFSVSLPNGRYRLKIKSPIGSDFIDRSLDDIIEVDNNENLVLDDIILLKGRGAFKGTVKSNNGEVLEGVNVIVRESETADVAGSGFTNINGEYNISVSPGNYRVGAFSVDLSEAFINKYFDDVLTWVDAKVVSINSGDVQTIDFKLDSSACISGRVLNSIDLTSLVGFEVNAFQSDTKQWISSDKTDENGNYSICLPNGIYKIWVSNTNSEFKSQFFSNTEDIEKSKDIILSGEDITGIDLKLDK